MPIHHIIRGQHISPAMWQTAKQLRRKMTPAEIILWQKLKANRLHGYHFRRQQIIDKYIVDFYCHAAALVVEVDGEIHAQQTERDAERAAYLESCGLIILRFKNESIMNELNAVLQTISDVCRIRTRQPKETR